MKHPDGCDAQVQPEDRPLIEAIARDYRPEPLSPARQAAFRRRLEVRLQRRARTPWRLAAAVTATAAGAAVLWLALSYGGEPDIERGASVQTDPPLLHAFADPDEYGGERLEPRDFLPDDYAALASVLRVSVDGL